MLTSNTTASYLKTNMLISLHDTCIAFVLLSKPQLRYASKYEPTKRQWEIIQMTYLR